MNRWLMAAVIVLMATGCAVGAEDPELPPPPEPAQRSPRQTEPFSAELEEGSATSDLGSDLWKLEPPEVPVDIPPIPEP